ncbi:MAG: 4Fe-4S dicluster domain-containing protein [Candidatus Omnitrophica bacterium]|nr:4Fe-4S dicluster domain-containing protein [Candidatus Omnitrophota bacterium]
MGRIKIYSDKCKGCALCITVCPNKLITMSKKLNKRGVHYAEFSDKKKCTGCAMCAIICPDACIEVYK